MSGRFHISWEFETRKARYGATKRGLTMVLWAATLWALAGTCSALQNMELQYTWGTFDFAFENEQQRQEMLARSDYAPQNATPFDMDKDTLTGRTFLSFPAFLPGSQVSLATIAEKDKRDSPQLAPYPDWSWHAGHRGCGGMTSVFRIFVDQCRRLWVIDSGVVDIGDTFQHPCPPQLLVFDLDTDKLLIRHRLTVPEEYKDRTMMLNVVTEQMDGSCDDVYAYIADPISFAIYVFSLPLQRSWRVESGTFLTTANATNFEIDGYSFSYVGGVLALAQNDENLYYHSFSSFQEASVAKRVLRDEALFANGTNSAADEFRFIGSRPNQSAGDAMAKNSVLFFHQLDTDSLYCWNASTEYSTENHHVVDHDDTLLHFVSNIKMISQGYEEEVWVIDNHGERLFADEFQPDQPYTVNIMKGSVSDMSKKCNGK